MSEILSWEETFISIAQVVAKRSKDPSTQVGAVIVSKDNRILSVGYNGAPNGFHDDIFPWSKDNVDPLKNKYLYVIHAETNAIVNFRGSLREMNGASVFITHFPCNECAKQIIQVGIKDVFYLNDHRVSDDSFHATKKMFDVVGVNLKQISSS